MIHPNLKSRIATLKVNKPVRQWKWVNDGSSLTKSGGKWAYQIEHLSGEGSPISAPAQYATYQCTFLKKIEFQDFKTLATIHWGGGRGETTTECRPNKGSV